MNEKLIFAFGFYATAVRPHCGMCREDRRMKENLFEDQREEGAAIKTGFDAHDTHISSVRAITTQ